MVNMELIKDIRAEKFCLSSCRATECYSLLQEKAKSTNSRTIDSKIKKTVTMEVKFDLRLSEIPFHVEPFSHFFFFLHSLLHSGK